MTSFRSTSGSKTPSGDDLPGVQDVARLVGGLRGSLAHHEIVEGRELPPLLAYLSAWQSHRLSRTYADLLADPDTSLACHFFLGDIYAPQDFSQRDHDGVRIYSFMRRFLPEAALHPLAAALELNSMTRQLDLALAEALQTHLGVIDHFEIDQYETAYRLCDNYADRVRQIEDIAEVGRHLIRLRRLPFISSTLRLARGPAKRLGWNDMQSFLERGFLAWKSLRRPDRFLATVAERELAILNRIYGRPGGAPGSNPFLVSDGGPSAITIGPSLD